MSRLQIRHETSYTYDRMLEFGEWRLMMRPTDSHALRVVEAQLELFPAGNTRWAYDAFGNSVCFFRPSGPSDRLSVVSSLVIERYPNPLTSAMIVLRPGVPVAYTDADRIVLAPLMQPDPTSSDPQYRDWLKKLSGSTQRDALEFLKQLNSEIHGNFEYMARNEENVQSPAQTLLLRSGACRDLAWLEVDAARNLGFAARFVTGYLFPGQNAQGAGATHAWCEIFLPALGWVEFDPTNGLTESDDLVRVAATRTPAEASPMCGHVVGAAVAQMTVNVHVQHVAPASRAA